MSQVGRNLIIIIQSFVSQVGEHRTDGAFRALKAFQSFSTFDTFLARLTFRSKEKSFNCTGVE